MTPPLSGDRSEPEVKPRSRRKVWMWWGAVTGVPLLLLVVITAAAWVISGWHASQKLAVLVEKVRARGEPLTTVELNDYYKPADDRPNMTEEIMVAIALCDDSKLRPLAAGLPIVDKGPEPPPPPQPWPQLPEVEAYLAHLAPALETFHLVALREGTARFPGELSPAVTGLMPSIRAMRQALRVLSLQFHVDLHRGRTSGAVERILAQLALARVIEQEPTLLSQLVRLTIVATALGHAQIAMQQADVEDADLARLQEGLRRIDDLSCLKRGLAGDRTFSYMACIATGIFTANDPVVLTPDEARQMANRPPQRVRDAAKMLELSLRVAEAADQSLLAALRESERVEAEAEELAKTVPGRFFYGLTLQFSSQYRAGVYLFVRSTGKRGCADAALAAERYRRRHGRWPEALEQLVPEYLPAVPVDPFNDQPVKMVVTAEELTIYSVGRDGEDNQGKLSIREEPHTDLGFVVPTRRGEPPQGPR